MVSVSLRFDKQMEYNGPHQFLTLLENISILLEEKEKWFFVMGFLMTLFRENYYMALINLQIERLLFSPVDFYLVGWRNSEASKKNNKERIVFLRHL